MIAFIRMFTDSAEIKYGIEMFQFELNRRE